MVGVKLGQFMGYDNLKDSAKPMHKSTVFDMINKIYGRFDKYFLSLGLLLGSASIKNVYDVSLLGNEDAVLKVKRPEIEKRIKKDLQFLNRVQPIPCGVVPSLSAYLSYNLDINPNGSKRKKT